MFDFYLALTNIPDDTHRIIHLPKKVIIKCLYPILLDM
jgi:hypothetical protein